MVVIRAQASENFIELATRKLSERHYPGGRCELEMLSKQHIYIDIGIWKGVCVVAFGKCAYVCTGYM